MRAPARLPEDHRPFAQGTGHIGRPGHAWEAVQLQITAGGHLAGCQQVARSLTRDEPQRLGGGEIGDRLRKPA